MSESRVELAKIVFAEMREVFEEYEFRLDNMDLSAVRPKDRFWYSQERSDLIQSKRRVGYLREAFIGKLLNLVVDEAKVSDLETLLASLTEQTKAEEALAKDIVRSTNRTNESYDLISAKALNPTEVCSYVDEITSRVTKGEEVGLVLKDVLKKISIKE